MSDYEYDDDDQSTAPKALREALAKANKELEQLRKTNADLAKQAGEARLSTIFKDKGVPANIQRWMKRDEVEATPEAVDKWLDENGADFGWKPGGEQAAGEQPEGKQSAEEAPAPVPQSVLSPEDIAAYQRVNAAVAAGSGPATPLDQQKAAVDLVAGQVDVTTDFGTVARLLAEQGIPVEGSIAYR